MVKIHIFIALLNILFYETFLTLHEQGPNGLHSRELLDPNSIVLDAKWEKQIFTYNYNIRKSQATTG